MNILNDVIHNTVLSLFPLLVYLIYTSYKNITDKKHNNLILNICLFSSLYLCLKLGDITKNDKIILFCNIPIVVAYIKKRPLTGLILSLLTLCYCEAVLSQNTLILIFKYLSFYLAYLICSKKKEDDNQFIGIIAILQGFFISFEFFYKNKVEDFNLLLEIFLLVLVFYVISFLALYLFKIGDNITKLHLTVKELEKEKQIRTSLFKITHEIKNPIAVCKGYLDMFDPNNIEKSARYSSIIKEEINRTLNILQDFLELSKVKITKEEIDINMLLEEIRDTVNLLANDKKINLEFNLLDEEIYLKADYNKLKQVFINIIKNSIEAINKEGTIKVSTSIDNHSFLIDIEDNGSGMDEETLNKLSNLFFTTKKNGTGLGIALSKEIISLHNGKIDYYSKENIGTKVIITLPIN